VGLRGKRELDCGAKRTQILKIPKKRETEGAHGIRFPKRCRPPLRDNGRRKEECIDQRPSSPNGLCLRR